MKLLGLLGCCAPICLMLWGYAIDRWLRVRRLTRLRATPLRDLRDGYVLAEGRVEDVGADHESQLDGAPCVYRRMDLRFATLDEEGQAEAQTLDSIAGETLWFSDDSGRGRVELPGAELELAENPTHSWPTIEAAPERLRRYLEARGYRIGEARGPDERGKRIDPETPVDYAEACIAPGEAVRVQGSVTLTELPGDLDGAPVPTFRATEESTLYVSTAPESGLLRRLRRDQWVGLSVALVATLALLWLLLWLPNA